MRQTSLSALHAAAGARLADIDGWSMAMDFGDAAAEYGALDQGVGLLDLSFRGKLRLTGPDRATFLHNMVTNDVVSLRPGQGCNAAKLTVQGKMEGALRIRCTADALWVDVDPGAAGKILDGLRKHLIMEDARIEDVTETYALLALQGPLAAQALGRLGVEAASFTQHLQHADAAIGAVPVTVARCDHAGSEGFDVWMPSAAAARVWQACLQAGIPPVGLAALDVRRIEAGLPWYGAEITGEQFPQEAGLEAGWISYTKGCYLGQETISRLHHLGHVNRQLCGLYFAANAAPPAAGAVIQSGEKRIGAVTSATRSPRLGRAVALGYVLRDFAAPGTRVAVQDRGTPVHAEVRSLPFE